MPPTGPWKAAPWRRLTSFRWIMTAGWDVWTQSWTSETAPCCTASVTGAWRDRSTAYAFSGLFTPAWQMVRWNNVNLPGTGKAQPCPLSKNNCKRPLPNTAGTTLEPHLLEKRIHYCCVLEVEKTDLVWDQGPWETKIATLRQLDLVLWGETAVKVASKWSHLSITDNGLVIMTHTVEASLSMLLLSALVGWCFLASH